MKKIEIIKNPDSRYWEIYVNGRWTNGYHTVEDAAAEAKRIYESMKR